MGRSSLLVSPSAAPDGVLFKGNLRGDPAQAYAKLTQRLQVQTLLCHTQRICPRSAGSMPTRHTQCSITALRLTSVPLPSHPQAELGDQYKLYLLEDQEEKPVRRWGGGNGCRSRSGTAPRVSSAMPLLEVPMPLHAHSCQLTIPLHNAQLQVAVVLPLASVLPQFGPLPEPALAALLGLTTVATTLNINGAELFNAALLTVGWDPAAVTEALPGTAAFLAILGEGPSGWQALSSALLPPAVWCRCCRLP